MKMFLFAMLLIGIQTPSWADQICGAAEARYVYELVDGMEQFAPKVWRLCHQGGISGRWDCCAGDLVYGSRQDGL